MVGRHHQKPRQLGRGCTPPSAFASPGSQLPFPAFPWGMHITHWLGARRLGLDCSDLPPSIYQLCDLRQDHQYLYDSVSLPEKWRQQSYLRRCCPFQVRRFMQDNLHDAVHRSDQHGWSFSPLLPRGSYRFREGEVGSPLWKSQHLQAQAVFCPVISLLR